MASPTVRLPFWQSAILLSIGLSSCSPSNDSELRRPLPENVVVMEGEVTAVRAKWTSDGSAIMTEATVVQPDGSSAAIHQLGGTVDGVGMLVSHHPPLLGVGQQVRFAAVPGQARNYVLREILAAPGSVFAADEPGTAKYGVNRTKQTGTPLAWASGCIHLSYHSAGVTHLAGNGEFRILDEATAEWQGESRICTDLAFSSSKTPDPGAGRNNINGVTFHEDHWCRPATETDPEVCHDPNAIAVTQVFFVDDRDSPRDGTILEADIEFNGVNFAFTEDGQTLGRAPRIADLRSTMTHELGHLLGLAHNCWTGIGARPADHNSKPVPSCSDVAAGSEFTEATMYFQQDEGETKKATIETSDLLGVCAGLSDVTCDRVVRGGCSVSSGYAGDAGQADPLPGSGLLLGLGFALAWLARRRGCPGDWYFSPRRGKRRGRR
ncbi:MAG: hypothetical protein MJE77_32245 [Proteobacteria bacterium]|nr:hypothetical protein [Pseudomonadota bacterium]